MISDAVLIAQESLSGTYSKTSMAHRTCNLDIPQADTVPKSTQDCFSHDICSFFNNAKGGARWDAIPYEDRNLEPTHADRIRPIVIRIVAAHSMPLLTIQTWALCMAARRQTQKIPWLCQPSLRRVADDGIPTIGYK